MRVACSRVACIGLAALAFLSAPPYGAAQQNATRPPIPTASNLVEPRDYPPIALRIRETGTAVLSVLVGVDGSCKDAVIVQSSGRPRLDAASINLCQRKFRWQPAMQDGIPVEARTATAVEWNLAPLPPEPPLPPCVPRQLWGCQ